MKASKPKLIFLGFWCFCPNVPFILLSFSLSLQCQRVNLSISVYGAYILFCMRPISNQTEPTLNAIISFDAVVLFLEMFENIAEETLSDSRK